jgi:hypothetical protein
LWYKIGVPTPVFLFRGFFFQTKEHHTMIKNYFKFFFAFLNEPPVPYFRLFCPLKRLKLTFGLQGMTGGPQKCDFGIQNHSNRYGLEQGSHPSFGRKRVQKNRFP